MVGTKEVHTTKTRELQTTNQSINQSNQPINQTNQSTKPTSTKPTNQTNQSYQPTNQSTKPTKPTKPTNRGLHQVCSRRRPPLHRTWRRSSLQCSRLPSSRSGLNTVLRVSRRRHTLSCGNLHQVCARVYFILQDTSAMLAGLRGSDGEQGWTM
jgi:hypothetical protein